jgi:hypothetical protein
MAVQTVQKFGKMPDAANATSSAQKTLALSVPSEDHCFFVFIDCGVSLDEPAL